MMLATVVLVPTPYASLASAVPAQAWTAYVVNSGSNTVTPIDTATNTAGSPIAVGSTPEGIAITPNGATAYVTNYGDGTVTPIDTATNTAGVPIAAGNHPYSIAITPNGATAYVTNATGNGTVTPIDTSTNTAGPPIAVGDTPDAIAITPNGATAYVANALDGTVTPINTSTNTAGMPIGGFGDAHGIAMTPNGTTAYVVNRAFGTVTPIDTATNTIGTSITIGNQPVGVAITPNGSTAYVTKALLVVTPQDITDGGITPIDIATGTTGSSITGVGHFPVSVAITPDGSTVYVASFPGAGGNTLTPVNTTTAAAGTPVVVGTDPNDVAITPDQAPVARLTVAPAPSGQPTNFDASASTVAFGTITSYAWDFGDGSSAITSTPTATHTFTAPGPFTASVTETDSAGTSTIQVFTGQTMSNNGGPSAVASRSFTVPSSTAILIPSDGATLSRRTVLDASAPDATRVDFLLFGGIYGFSAPVICTATPTLYGWLCVWHTRIVPNGTYVLVAEAFNSIGHTFSSGVPIAVRNHRR